MVKCVMDIPGKCLGLSAKSCENCSFYKPKGLYERYCHKIMTKDIPFVKEVGGRETDVRNVSFASRDHIPETEYEKKLADMSRIQLMEEWNKVTEPFKRMIEKRDYEAEKARKYGGVVG